MHILADVLYQAVCEFTDHVTRESFDEKLAKGKVVILLDGFDETVGMTRYVFQLALTNFIKKYHDSMIVMTTRPFNTFAQIAHFTTLEIEPFNKEQALALIDKLDFHDQEVKEAFKVDLDKKLYDSHKEFAGNPLLLTIMLMTYDSYGDVPAKRHIFYRKAYEVMARLHDTTKGTYVRPMHTKLEPDELAQCFASFCAVTYQEGILEFTEEAFCSYMDKIIRKINEKNLLNGNHRLLIGATAKEFLLDLTDNLCILYKEGERYYFIHRSFQEYFCAVFIANQMDDKLYAFGQFFETQKNRAVGDHTFDMLYDMIPSRMDRYVFLPYLKELWAQYDQGYGYRSFLWHQYRNLYIDQGTVGKYYENDPKSFLYNFIINEQGFRGNGLLDNLPWPASIEAFKETEWVNVNNGTVTYHEWEENYDTTQTPNICGTNYMIGLEYLYDNPQQFADIIAFAESDDFPLKQEYGLIGRYIKQLEEQFNYQTKSTSWLDLI